MSKSRLTTSFTRYRDSELETKARFIIESMTDNPNFKDPVPSLTVIVNSINAYTGALKDVEGGGKSVVAKKNEERRILENLLTKLALYVEAYGNDNEVILLSSGFTLAKASTPVGVLPKPHDFSVTSADIGTATLKFSTIYGADSYQFEYRLANTKDVWITQTSTKTSLKIKGLERGVMYEFRVAGVGTNPDRIYSDIITSFVL